MVCKRRVKKPRVGIFNFLKNLKMSLLDSLKELSTVISDVADFEVPDDLTEIYEYIVSHASAM